MQTSTPLFTVDAFTSTMFRGNPAAVCLLPTAAPEPWMRALAAEMRHSETAFVIARKDGGWDLRWLTPKVEVELCGHATLASAHVLWKERGVPKNEPIRFHTKSGVLTCTLSGGRIEMDFPAKPPALAPAPADLARA